jgi:hypothetical protein
MEATWDGSVSLSAYTWRCRIRRVDARRCMGKPRATYRDRLQGFETDWNRFRRGRSMFSATPEQAREPQSARDY